MDTTERGDASCSPVLSDNDALRRLVLLDKLSGRLEDRGLRCTVARRQRLVLSGTKSPMPPSGPTDPTLHVFTPGGTVVVKTDGAAYILPSGRRCDVSAPAAAAQAVAREGGPR